MPSDTTLVTSYGYSPAGYVQSVTDPRRIVTETTYDMLGQVLQTIDGYSTLINGGLPTTSANATTDYTYNAIGAVTVHNSNRVPVSRNVSAFGRRYGHQGGRLDPVTGWYDFRNRDYIPSEGRRAERDPMGFGGGNLDLYGYLNNSVLNQVDHFGLGDNDVKMNQSPKVNYPNSRSIMIVPNSKKRTCIQLSKRNKSARDFAISMIKRNYLYYKQNIVDSVFNLLISTHPDMSAFPNTKFSTSEAARQANFFADAYIQAVLEFLNSHPGAKPKLDSRSRITDQLVNAGLVDAPWCSDWADFISSKMLDPLRHGELSYLRIQRAQWNGVINGQAYQHNYVLVYQRGHSSKYMSNIDKSLLILDPWKNLLPDVFPPIDNSIYSPINPGSEPIGFNPNKEE